MSSLRLSTQLQQKMVLTPQLRQRIEMLQMTSMELSELIEQELVANPILEEVLPGEEVQEISDNILDQNAEGFEDSGADKAKENGDRNDDRDSAAETGEEYSAEMPGENGFEDSGAADTDRDDDSRDSDSDSDSFDEIDYGREFQDYLDPGYRTQEIEYKEDAPSFDQFLSHTPTLSEHL